MASGEPSVPIVNRGEASAERVAEPIPSLVEAPARQQLRAEVGEARADADRAESVTEEKLRVQLPPVPGAEFEQIEIRDMGRLTAAEGGVGRLVVGQDRAAKAVSGEVDVRSGLELTDDADAGLRE